MFKKQCLPQIGQNFAFNIFIVWTNDLGAILPVHFVAIVLFGIVRCRYHDTGQTSFRRNGKRYKWCGHHFAVQPNGNVSVQKNGRRQLGKSKNEAVQMLFLYDKNCKRKITVCYCSDHRNRAQCPGHGPQRWGNTCEHTGTVLGPIE